MTENQKKSDRQYAASIARKFFSGQISKHQVIDSFPNFETDFKLRLLYNRIIKKPRRSWLWGVTKEEYEKFLIETYEIIEDLETGKLRLRVMIRLFKELWLRSGDCSVPIEHISIAIKEVAHSTNSYKEDIRRYLLLLIDNNYIKKISDDPLLFEFTATGKKIKNDSDIELIFNNIVL